MRSIKAVRLFVVIWLAIVATTPAILRAQQTPRQLFDRARIQDASNHLIEAISLYEQVTAGAKGDPELAAQARFQIGADYEKLNSSPEAQKAYQQLLDDYPNARAAVDARRRLSFLTGSLAQRLACRWSSEECNPEVASLSADGGFMAFAQQRAVFLRNMRTSEVTTLAPPDATDHVGVVGGCALSPDARQSVCSWIDDTGDQRRWVLKVLPSETGGKSRTVLDNPDIRESMPIAWAHDGKSVLVLLGKPDDTWQLAWIALAGGSPKPIKSLGWRFRTICCTARYGVSLSPDGQFIAYSALPINPSNPRQPTTQAERDNNIYVIAADGSGSEIPLVKGSNNRFPTWMPDGKNLLFVSDRSGSNSLWSAPVFKGAAAGEPVLVRKDVGGMFPLGMTRSGSYYYSTPPVAVPKVAIATLDSDTVQRQGGLSSTGVMGSQPMWSPDGKRVAIRNSIGGLSLYSVDNANENRYALPDGATMPAAGMGRVWSHDGKFILFRLQDRAGASLYQFSVNAGEFKRVGTDSSSGTIVVSLDDKTAYGFVRGEAPRSPDRRMDRIVAIDLSSGKQTPISTVPDAAPTPLILSPDGKTLYLKSACPVDWRCGSITAVHLTNAQRREVYTVEDAEKTVIQGEFSVSADGHALALITRTEEASVLGKSVSNLLLIIGVDGQDRRVLQSTSGSIGAPAWNPDGSAVIAIAGRQLVRIPIVGSAEVILTIPKDQDTRYLVQNYGGRDDLGTFSISPDGSHVALDIPAVSSGELWALDNVSSFLKTAR